ncbi:hypothetical protein G7B40_038000 [Aetokthonos hydrillicola Thurmond2011]|jgi:hypothetical protein|uniref:Uncharacterized protein n=1 Tax=Aetokthonos hydrillicola Thurmond2011 TaxID=2712845 RepID=A0AAP5MDA5_9CYAN|nr:hypothetical protein [Aetokthonos hydrillicola]MBO3463096.1 hypothetical protein [Aetokthonos hydrillicola CCALA 1050]MDR9900302.1 hypothetical protein [Aetokthonos hydrillicola Thurmond2011]
MTEANNPDKNKELFQKPGSPDKPIDYDWRDPSKPRNLEDDEIIEGWRRRADGTFEKVEQTEEE